MTKKYKLLIALFLFLVATLGVGIYLTYSNLGWSSFQENSLRYDINPFSKQGNNIARTASELETQTQFSATFVIFTNGVFRIFTSPMYHNQSDVVFIASNNPNTIIVTKEGVTWNDFFQTLPFSLTQDCLTTGTGETFCTTETYTLKFYLNGINTPDLLSRVIQSNDSLLISYGPINDPHIPSQIQKLTNL